jgi:site-specific recombinase
MGRSSLKAGFLVGFMALFKVLTGKLLLAPMGFALLYALNYSLGFVIIHMVHGTLATKQPAMTASLLAQSFEQSKVKLDNLVELVVDIVRSQIIAIFGNIALAFPTALVIGWVWEKLTGHTLLGEAKALKVLDELDPTHPSALIYAGVAGICLFTAGLISGHYDNKAKYNHIAARIACWPWLIKLSGECALIKFRVMSITTLARWRVISSWASCWPLLHRLAVFWVCRSTFAMSRCRLLIWVWHYMT